MAEAADRGLRVREIYRSIQGESSYAGWPCVFVRTSGCDIRCGYCDEPQAFSGGEWLETAEVVRRVEALVGPGDAAPGPGSGEPPCPARGGRELVEITGGEPLLWRAVPRLASQLLAGGFEVLLETGGHHDISVLDPRVRVILDVKTPGSGEQARSDPANLDRLKDGHELKFVLCDRRDYEFARDLVRSAGLEGRVPVHLSPVHGRLDPRELSRWLLDDRLRVRLNLQLHKYVWGADASGV